MRENYYYFLSSVIKALAFAFTHKKPTGIWVQCN